MKRIGIITTNKVLAESLIASMKARGDLGFEPFQLLDPNQAALDVGVLRINVAVVDVMDGPPKETDKKLELCTKLRRVAPDCRLLLLVSQDGKTGRKMAIEAKKNKIADDFVFYDTSLQYLLAKLAAF